MYAYSVDKNGEEESLTDWRKHNRLHGFMEELWEDKGRPNFNISQSQAMGDFNCVPVELTFDDLENLFESITNKTMPETGGFFFGDDSFDWEDKDGKPYGENDYYYKEQDLTFIRDACKAIKEEKKVYYNSWW